MGNSKIYLSYSHGGRIQAVLREDLFIDKDFPEVIRVEHVEHEAEEDKVGYIDVKLEFVENNRIKILIGCEIIKGFRHRMYVKELESHLNAMLIHRTSTMYSVQRVKVGNFYYGHLLQSDFDTGGYRRIPRSVSIEETDEELKVHGEIDNERIYYDNYRLFKKEVVPKSSLSVFSHIHELMKCNCYDYFLTRDEVSFIINEFDDSYFYYQIGTVLTAPETLPF